MAYTNFTNCTQEEYEEIIYSQDDKNRIRIWFNNVELSDAGEYCESLSGTNRIFPNDGSKRFSLDNFVAKDYDLILRDLPSGTNITDQVRISIGTLVDEDNNTYEDVPIGIFNIQDTPTTDQNKITIKLRDNRVKFDFDYNAQPLIESEGGSATLKQILNDICTQAGVTSDVSTFNNENMLIGTYDSTIKATTYVSYIAEQAGAIPTITREGHLDFIQLDNLTTWRIPLSIVEKYEIGTPYQIQRVVYESGIVKYETSSDETLDTLYINGANPYISDQEQIDTIFDEVEDFEIDSVTTGKILGNPAIDAYDLIEIYDEDLENNPIVTNPSTEFSIDKTIQKEMKVSLKSSELTVDTTTGASLVDFENPTDTGICTYNNSTKIYTSDALVGDWTYFYIRNNNTPITIAEGINKFYYSADIRLASGTYSYGKLNIIRTGASFPNTTITANEISNPNLTNSFQRYIFEATYDNESGGEINDDIYMVQLAYGANNAVLELKNLMISNENVPYEPYTGGIPAPNSNYSMPIHTINGNNKIIVSDGNGTTQEANINLDFEFCKVGNYEDEFYVPSEKNILDVSEGFQNGYINTSGNFVAQNVTAVFNQNIEVEAGQTYCFSTNANVDNLVVSMFGSNNTYKSRTKVTNTDRIVQLIPSDVAYVRFSINKDNRVTMTQSIIDDLQPMAEKNNTRTEYEPCNNGFLYIKKNINKIANYNGESITTSYISSTGGLDIGATVYYGSTTPTYIAVNETLTAQLENVFNNLVSYNGQTNIYQENADLPFNLVVSIYKDTLILKSLANCSYTFNGVHRQTFDTQIGKEQRIENVTKNNEATYKKTIRAEFDNVEAELNVYAETTNNLEGRLSRAESTISSQGATLEVVTTNIDTTTGDITALKRTNYEFGQDGIVIDDEQGYKSVKNTTGDYYYDNNTMLGKYTKDGAVIKDLALFGKYYYGIDEDLDVATFSKDDAMFMAQLYEDNNGVEAFGHFYNG